MNYKCDTVHNTVTRWTLWAHLFLWRMSVWNSLLKTREKSAGDRNPGGISQIGRFLFQSAEKLPSLGFFLGKIWSRQSCQGQRELGIETCWGRASGRAWADPGSSISLYTSFPMSCKLLSTHPHTGKHSIWRTHAPVSQITLEWWWFCSFEKDSSFETLIKC